jgi:L-2-hydroxyglutarate oxidase LhgO
MRALADDARAAGAALAFRAPVVGAEVDAAAGGFLVHAGGPSPASLRCATLVNAAGLGAQAVAERLEGLPPATIPPLHLAKGHYFVLAGASPFRRLVYPLAGGGGLGVHVTMDLAGRARFGPDIEWQKDARVDYTFDEGRQADFYAAIRRYWPALPEGALGPGYTGIRPKLSPAGAPARDFSIAGPEDHGVPGLVNLYGIADEVLHRLSPRA